MPLNTTIPVTISPEATDYIAELGMQDPFQGMLDHALKSIPGLREIQVELQPAYDSGMPCVLLNATTEDPHLEDDPSQREYGHWQSAAFPPEVCEHFVLLVNYGFPNAR